MANIPGHTKDSLWSVDLFRCESIRLRSHCVLFIMDQFTRRIIGFGVHQGDVDGVALCCLYNQTTRERLVFSNRFILKIATARGLDARQRISQWGCFSTNKQKFGKLIAQGDLDHHMQAQGSGSIVNIYTFAVMRRSTSSLKFQMEMTSVCQDQLLILQFWISAQL